MQSLAHAHLPLLIRAAPTTTLCPAAERCFLLPRSLPVTPSSLGDRQDGALTALLSTQERQLPRDDFPWL